MTLFKLLLSEVNQSILKVFFGPLMWQIMSCSLLHHFVSKASRNTVLNLINFIFVTSQQQVNILTCRVSVSQWQVFHTPVQAQPWPIEGPIWEGGVGPSTTRSVLHLLLHLSLLTERECLLTRATCTSPSDTNTHNQINSVWQVSTTENTPLHKSNSQYYSNTGARIHTHTCIYRRIVSGKQKRCLLIERKIALWFQNGQICLSFFKCVILYSAVNGLLRPGLHTPVGLLWREQQTWRVEKEKTWREGGEIKWLGEGLERGGLGDKWREDGRDRRRRRTTRAGFVSTHLVNLLLVSGTRNFKEVDLVHLH